MLHPDDSILFAVFYKKEVIHSNRNNRVREITDDMFYEACEGGFNGNG